MGSSILASLSEAGGNDPFLPMSGPLPPHSPVGRIVLERDPLLSLCKSWPISRSPGRNFHRCVFSHLVADAQIQHFPRIPIWEVASRTGTDSPPLAALFASALPFSPHFSRTAMIETCPTFRAAA
jgi:hypothetical protein